MDILILGLNEVKVSLQKMNLKAIAYKPMLKTKTYYTCDKCGNDFATPQDTEQA